MNKIKIKLLAKKFYLKQNLIKFHNQAQIQGKKNIWAYSYVLKKQLIESLGFLPKLQVDHSPHVNITLQCNLKCPYCADGIFYDQTNMGYTSISTKEWIEIIKALPGDNVIFTGGEPTLYKGLSTIINGIDNKRHIILFTNITYNVEKFMSQLTQPIVIDPSFHPCNPKATPDSIIENIKTITAHPMCLKMCNLHIIDHPSNGDWANYREIFARHGIKLVIEKDQFQHNFHGVDSCNGKILKKVICTNNEILLGPDGKRRICVSKLVRNTPDGFLEKTYDKIPEMVCAEFGNCAPCNDGAKIREIS